jgi:hypothetical protein
MANDLVPTKKYYKNTMLSYYFYKNENQSIMMRTRFSRKVSFYRVPINIFLDIYKMSKKVLGLLIMMAFPRLIRLIGFPT